MPATPLRAIHDPSPMPIYAFECDACGHQFDRLQRLSDPDPTECPECGAAQVRRQLTAPAFRLSGSGWYETDFKKDGDKKRNLTDTGDAPKTDPLKSDPPKSDAPKSDAPKSDPAPALKPAESAPTAKPADSKSASSKPADSKPAT
jgi:putative FmdB family regulatory protein